MSYSQIVLSHEIVNDLLEQLSENSRYRGAWVNTPQPVIAFRVPPEWRHSPVSEIPEPSLVRGGSGASYLGGLLFVRLAMGDRETPYHVAIPGDSPLLTMLASRSVQLALFDKEHPVVVRDVRLRRKGSGELIVTNGDAPRVIIADPEANYHLFAPQFPWLEKLNRPSDLLAFGWAKSYNSRVLDVQTTLDALASDEVCERLQAGPVPDAIKEWCNALLEANYSLESLLRHLTNLVEYDGKTLYALLVNTQAFHGASVPQARPDDLQRCGLVTREICETYAWSSLFTGCGMRMPWIDTMHETVETWQIEPQLFPSGFSAEDYWNRLIWDLPYELPHLLSPGDVPAHPAKIAAAVARFPQVEDIEGTSRLADELFDEAVANKRWTILSHFP